MCCTTYLNASDKNRPINNTAIVEWLTKLRELSGRDWQVIEHVREIPRWFRKPKTLRFYELMVGVGNGIEYQVLNFYRDDTTWSINQTVRAELIVAYLIGACGAVQSTMNAHVRENIAAQPTARMEPRIHG